MALKAALSARKDNLVIVSGFEDIKEGKTKEFSSLLKGLKLEEKKILLVLDGYNDADKKVERSARNIERLTVVRVSNLNVKELLNAEAVLVAEPVLEVISNRFKPAEKQEAAPKAKKEKKAATSEPTKAVKAPKKEAAPAAKEPKSKAAPAKSKPASKAKKEQ